MFTACKRGRSGTVSTSCKKGGNGAITTCKKGKEWDNVNNV